MFEEKIKDLVISSLVIDSYCLGTHWVYDEEQLIDNSINWNALNVPIAYVNCTDIPDESICSPI